MPLPLPIMQSQLSTMKVKNFEQVSSLPQQDPDATVTVNVKYSDLMLGFGIAGRCVRVYNKEIQRVPDCWNKCGIMIFRFSHAARV